jgi:hypothetical protein
LGNLAIHQCDLRRGVIVLGAGGSNLPTRTYEEDVNWDENESSLTLARAVLGEDAFAQARAGGEAMTLDQAVAYALADDTEAITGFDS